MNIEVLREKYMPIFDEIRKLPEFEEFAKNSDINNFYLFWNAIRDNEILDCYGDTGETKGVIVPCDEDVVFKFPLLSRCKNFDYCRAEVRNYRAAVQEELDKYFAWTDKLFDIHFEGGYFPVYAMEFIDCDVDAITEMMVEKFCENNSNPQACEENGEEIDEDEYEKYEDGYNAACSGTSEGVDEYFHSSLSVSEYARLSQFLRYNDIDDIHSGNLGFNGGLVVIIDYSGYAFVCEHTESEWYSKYGL